MIRDMSINSWKPTRRTCSHRCRLAISLGVGSQAVPFVMPAVENINGQAITLHVKHKGVKEAKDMKGFKFCVPFDYSMHNFLFALLSRRRRRRSGQGRANPGGAAA